MKKFGILTVVVLILCTLVVGAEDAVLEKTVDISNGMIYVSGTSDKLSETATVQVFKDVAIESVNTVTVANDASVWVGQVTTGEDGSFAFEFEYNGSADSVLNGYLAFESSTQPQHFVIPFTSYTATYSPLIAALNDASGHNLGNTEDFNTFSSLCNANKTALCPQHGLVGAIDFDKAVETFFAEVKAEALLDTNSIDNQKRFMNCLVAQAVNEKKLTGVNAVADYLAVTEGLVEDIKMVSSIDNADGYFAKLLCDKGITSNQDLETKMEAAMKEAMILAYVAYNDGFANFKTLCEEYATDIGIAGKNYSAEVYSKVSGSKPISYGELCTSLGTAYNEVLAEDDDPDDGGGGGGGGGGNSFGITGDETPANPLPEVKMPFEDLSATSWAYTAVSTLADKGIVNGKTATEFYPNDYVTREEFVKMIVGALGLDTGSLGEKFSDVNEKEWYAPFVYSGYKNGVCQGVSETEFGVGRNIIRQDAAVMVYNVLSNKSKGTAVAFDDAKDISDYAKAAVDTLSSMQIINGKGNNCFEPLNTLTRAEAAQIIYKSFFAN